MRVSIVAGMIVAVHVAVVGSVVMTQGCASSKREPIETTPLITEPAPAPVLPPSAPVLPPHPVSTVSYPTLQPPVKPEPVKTSVAAENVYVVKSGDSLSKIAVKHGVSSRELAELNQITDPNKVRIGQKLILPDYSKPSQSQPSAKAPKAKAVSGDLYEVKSGDSLSKIAVAHGVKTKELMAANQIADANKVRIGQKLVIPGKAKEQAVQAEAPKADAPAADALAAPVSEAPKNESSSSAEVVMAPAPVAPVAGPVVEAAAPVSKEPMLDYTVQVGDTIESIARLFVVRQDDIRRVNNIPVGQDVKPAQRIQIPPASSL